jgi:hypothetical protein
LDVAAAGGWKNTAWLRTAYQQGMRGLPLDHAKANNPEDSDGTSTAIPPNRIGH